MKIGIDIRTLMDVQYSGVPEYTYNLLSEIFKLDHNNEYRLFYNSAKDISGRMPKFNHPNVKVFNTSYPNKILNYIGFKMFNRPKLDVMLGVDVFFMPHINFIGLSENTKSVLTIHDLSFLKYPRLFSFRKNVWHSSVDVKKLAQRAGKIVAVSENTKNDIINLCSVPAEKIEVVHSGISSDFKKLDSKDQKLSALVKKYDLPDKFILFLGTIEPRKNIDGLIEAFSLLKQDKRFFDTKLVIAGGKGWKGGEIMDAWLKSPVKDEIIFLGFVSDEDKISLYNLASIFVYPSFYEGFGFPPLEAMACGTPVVTSISSSLPEVVGDGAILIDPDNIADMARAIKNILVDDNLRLRMAEKGLERAKQFSWPEVAERYLKIFSGLK